MKFVAVALATLSVAHSAAAYKGRHNEPQFRGRAIDHRAQLNADVLYQCLDDCLDDQLSSFDGESSIEQSLDECNEGCIVAAEASGTDRTVAEGMVDCLEDCTKDIAKTYEKEFDKAVDQAVEDCEDECEDGDTECEDDCSSGDVSDVSTNSAEKAATREGDKCYQECVGPETVQDFKAALKASGKATLKAVRQAEQSFAREMGDLNECVSQCPDDEFSSLSIDTSVSEDEIEQDLDDCADECVQTAETRGLSTAAGERYRTCISGCNQDAAKKLEKEVQKAISSAVDDCEEECEDSCDEEDPKDCDCDKECKSKDVSNISADTNKARKEAEKCYPGCEAVVRKEFKNAALKVARRKLA